MPTATKHRPQISLALMLLLMSIFAVMSAGMFYASRVGAVRDELALLTGSTAASTGESSRVAHLVFLMFTYTSPILLAVLLGGIVRWSRFRESRAAAE
jgi:hypothetical protein